ncbi:hypothetical protein BH10PSE5_BH10PSE5_04940 [soil metagenome]
MRILVTIAHYLSAEANGRHASTREARRDDRKRAIEEVICAYRGQFGVSTAMDVGSRTFQPGVGSDDDALYGAPFGRQMVMRRARNRHSGFFALIRDQLNYWMRRPHWRDGDVSFISPLESAATLGVAKTFSIYKAYGRSAGFLEIEHLDSGFSSQKMPVVPPL